MLIHTSRSNSFGQSPTCLQIADIGRQGVIREKKVQYVHFLRRSLGVASAGLGLTLVIGVINQLLLPRGRRAVRRPQDYRFWNLVDVAPACKGNFVLGDPGTGIHHSMAPVGKHSANLEGA